VGRDEDDFNEDNSVHEHIRVKDVQLQKTVAAKLPEKTTVQQWQV
jgi:hypothetical protein